MKRITNKERRNHARYVKISTYVFILYAFSFPFLTVSCTKNMQMKYTGYECITGRKTEIASIHEAKPIIYVQVPYLIVVVATFITVVGKHRFWKLTMLLDLSVVLIFMTIIVYVAIKKIKAVLIPKAGWSVFGMRDKIECELNYGFWVIFASMVFLLLSDIRGIRKSKRQIGSRSKKGRFRRRP